MTQVEQIEKRLAELRRDLTASEGRRLAQRTAAMTLIAVLPDESAVPVVCDAISVLASRHPARVIVISPDDNPNGPTLQFEVSATCARIAEREDIGMGSPLVSGVLNGMGGTGATLEAVCQEEVILRWRDASPGRLVSVVRPLMLPDLPVHVWWAAGDPSASDEMFRRLVEDADRLLVDTGRMREPWNTMLLLESIRTEPSLRCVPADVAWTRLTPWRDALAHLADDPEVGGFLSSLSGPVLYLEYATPNEGDLGPAGQALLMAGWLGHRLGWSPRSGWHVGDRAPRQRFLTLGITGRDGPVATTAGGVVRPSRQAGELESLMMETATGSLNAVRTGDKVSATFRSAQGAVRTATASLTPLELSASLRNVLDRPVEDREYCSALQFVGDVVRSEEANAWAATW